MMTAGVDVGAETVKAVILGDGKMLASAVVRTGLRPRVAGDQALASAAETARIRLDEIDRIVATGIGGKDVAAARDCLPEFVADARGVTYLFPSARTVIAIGAEEARGMRLDGDGNVVDCARNGKCAAGVGSFVEAMARALELRLDEIGPISLKSQQNIPLNATCVVFAESEVVSLVHDRTPIEDIACAIHEAVASRTMSMLRRVGIERDVVLIGGLARNVGVVARLERHVGGAILVPEAPQVVGALGAALIAAETGGGA